MPSKPIFSWAFLNYILIFPIKSSYFWQFLKNLLEGYERGMLKNTSEQVDFFFMWYYLQSGKYGYLLSWYCIFLP